jgi:hypothetical protein
MVVESPPFRHGLWGIQCIGQIDFGNENLSYADMMI